MAWSVFASSTITADGTEQSISAPNVVGTFIAHVDLTNLADQDIVVLRAYKTVKSGGSAILRYEQPYYGAQHVPNAQVGPALPNALAATNALKFTLQQTAGTNRTYDVVTESQ